MTHHTHTETHTDRYRYHFYILHFLPHLAYMPKIQILYLAYHRLPHAQTLRHAHTWKEILTHRYKYTQTHACLYTYTNTHTDIHVGNNELGIGFLDRFTWLD